MRPYVFVPTLALRMLRRVLILTGMMPMMLFRIDVEIALREMPESDEPVCFWCPAAAGVA